MSAWGSRPRPARATSAVCALEGEHERATRQREALSVAHGGLAHLAQPLLALVRLLDDERARGREVGDERVRARLLDALDDGPPHFPEPGCARQLLFTPRLVARETDQLGELGLQRIALVPPIPEQGEPAAGSEDAVQLGHSELRIEPVIRLPREGGADALVSERDRLGRALEPLDAGHSDPELVEHAGARLDGNDVEAHRDEAARQLPG